MRPSQEKINLAGSMFLNEAANRVTCLIRPAPSLGSVADCLVIGTAPRLEANVMADIYLLVTKVRQHIWREIECKSNPNGKVLTNS